MFDKVDAKVDGWVKWGVMVGLDVRLFLFLSLDHGIEL
jgi:hypothetical protein